MVTKQILDLAKEKEDVNILHNHTVNRFKRKADLLKPLRTAT